MTSGTSSETLDRVSTSFLNEMSKRIQAGQFRFTPAHRVWIPKPGKTEKRPLNVANPREKIVQKSMQLVLERIFQEKFLDSSLGFRPKPGNHTALRSVYLQFQAAVWVIEADITKCFDTINHDILLQLIRKYINCDKTIALLKSGLEAGHLDGKCFQKGEIRTPQGSVLSPLLCKIYMHELEVYIEQLKEELSLKYPSKEKRVNPDYQKNLRARKRARDLEERKRLTKVLFSTPSKDPEDPNYRKIIYVRYADDFIVGVAGPHGLAIEIQDKIEQFLKEKLGLRLNETKTKVTNFIKEEAFFLGTRISKSKLSQKKVIVNSLGQGKRINSTVRLKAPTERLLEGMAERGFLEHQKNGEYKAKSLGRVVNLDLPDILKYYSSVIRGITNFYSFVCNKAALAYLYYLLKDSCVGTMANKFKLKNRKKVYEEYTNKLKSKETGVELWMPDNSISVSQHLIRLYPEHGIPSLLDRASSSHA